MIEIATGKFPYQLWATPFEQLKQVSHPTHPVASLRIKKFDVHHYSVSDPDSGVFWIRIRIQGLKKGQTC